MNRIKAWLSNATLAVVAKAIVGVVILAIAAVCVVFAVLGAAFRVVGWAVGFKARKP